MNNLNQRIGGDVREAQRQVGGRAHSGPAPSLQPIWSHRAENCQLAEHEKKAGHDTPVVMPKPG
jgi:hypothetical protein